MKILIITLTCLPCLMGWTYGQTFTFEDLPDFFELRYEILSIANQTDQLYLASEKCNYVFVLDSQKLHHDRTIRMDTDKLDLDKTVQIEGMTIYENYLLMADEANTKILFFDLAEEQFINPTPKITFNGKKDFDEEQGLEGVAVNTRKKLIYVLREKNENDDSEIYTFKITKDSGSYMLSQKGVLVIDQHDEQRYSGMTFNQEDHKLYCIRSSWINGMGRYFIDTIRIAEKDGLLADSLDSSETQFLEITDTVLSKDEVYHSNLEGIAIIGRKLVLVSDNHQGTTGDCDSRGKQTMFLTIGW